jgi:hypothetical protein
VAKRQAVSAKGGEHSQNKLDPSGLLVCRMYRSYGAGREKRAEVRGQTQKSKVLPKKHLHKELYKTDPGLIKHPDFGGIRLYSGNLCHSLTIRFSAFDFRAGRVRVRFRQAALGRWDTVLSSP